MSLPLGSNRTAVCNAMNCAILIILDKIGGVAIGVRLTPQHGQCTHEPTLVLIDRRTLVQQLNAKMHTSNLDGCPHIFGLVYVRIIRLYLGRLLGQRPQSSPSPTLTSSELVLRAFPVVGGLRPSEKHQHLLPWLDMLLHTRHIHICLQCLRGALVLFGAGSV